MRVATCRLLECLALAQIPLAKEDITTFTVKYSINIDIFGR